MSRKIFFVSDLHLQSRRSNGHKHFETMIRLAADADAFVLGGDIFDFRWSTERCNMRAVDNAAAWLDEFCRKCPNCMVHYVLGNHDHLQVFLDRLQSESFAVPNFRWHPYYFRDGANVFLHGDIIEGKKTTEEFIRHRLNRLEHEPKPAIQHALYSLAIWTRIHVPLPYLAWTKKKVARRVAQYLEENGLGHESGIRHVYFGHTHIPFRDFHYADLIFHNAGAAVKGVRSHIIQASDQYDEGPMVSRPEMTGR